MNDKIKEKGKTYAACFGGSMLFACALYALLMTHQLVNPYDGLWEYSYHTAKGWELSLGRWFWLYLDQLRLGISVDPLNSILSLSIFSLGTMILLDLFDIGKKKIGYFIAFLFLSNVIVCISLSYRYMSPTFAVAFFLSILAAWVMMKGKKYWISVALGAVLLAFSMGAYQAYIGCTCVALLGYLLYALLEKDRTLKEILFLLSRCAVSCILGGIAYFVILNIHLKIFHVALSGYNGANQYSFGNTLSRLWPSIRRTYDAFKLYFFGSYFLSNVFQKYKIFIAAFLVVGILLCCGMLSIWKESKLKAILFIALILVMPIACGAILLVTTDTDLSMQMTAAWGLCIPVLLCVVSKIKKENRFVKISNCLCLLVMGVVLYGNIYQVTLDQNAMLEGKIATTTMTNDILGKLGEEACLDADLEYCILGVPAGNRLFAVSDIFGGANTYAKFGVWWQNSSCTRRSWNGVFHYLCGMNLNIASEAVYNEIMANEEVQNMPAYPEEGFICQIGNVVVIKVAE